MAVVFILELASIKEKEMFGQIKDKIDGFTKTDDGIYYKVVKAGSGSVCGKGKLFRLITGVSGMGAASARMILSSMTSGELEEAILSENVNALKSVKGIGLKSAQRMILELKDKIVKGGAASSDMLFQADSNAAADEASSALQMLGFTKANVTKAIQAILKANPRATVEQIIKSALQML